MVPTPNSGLIDGYKERLWLRLHLIFLQSSLKELSTRAWWRKSAGWAILKDLAVTVLVGFLHLREISENIHLQPDVHWHIWRLTSSGTYSSKAAYNEFFFGTISFTPWKRIWQSRAPLRCKMFIWFEVLNCCWTAYRLSKLRLPHLAACPLCDKPQKPLTICWCHVWITVFHKFGLHTLTTTKC